MKSLPSLLTLLALLCGSTFFLAEAQELRLTTSDAKAQFDKADQALNAAWNAAKSKLLEEDFARLKLDQRNWLIYRDNLARSPIFAGGDGQGELALTSPYYLSAAAALEEERTKWVLGLIRDWDWDNDENLTGEWIDSYGGSIMIVEQKGALAFALECARGASSHLGNLQGTAYWNSPIGWFRIKGEESEEETNLCFLLREDHQLEIVGANTAPYHGKKAYFDGHYVKIRQLSAAEQKEVIEGRYPSNE